MLAGRIARALGDALVAPVAGLRAGRGDLSHRPATCSFPGTLTDPRRRRSRATHRGSAADSLRRAGFTHVVLIGDHGGYQALTSPQAAAEPRPRPGPATPARAHYIAAYYRRHRRPPMSPALRGRRAIRATPRSATHAGLAPTPPRSLALAPAGAAGRALNPAAPVTARPRTARLRRPAPRRCAALGRLGVDADRVSQTAAAIRRARCRETQLKPLMERDLSMPKAQPSGPRQAGASASPSPPSSPPAVIAARNSRSPSAPRQREHDRDGTGARAHQHLPELRSRGFEPGRRGRAGAVVYVPQRQFTTNPLCDRSRDKNKVIDHYHLRRANPQHVAPSYDLKTLWVTGSAKGRGVSAA